MEISGLNEEDIKLVKLAMESSVSKETFKKYLAIKRKSKTS